MKDYTLDHRGTSAKLRIRLPDDWTTDLALIAARKGMTMTTYLQIILQTELINQQAQEGTEDVQRNQD